MLRSLRNKTSEFRFWIADGEIMTLAAYAHDGPARGMPSKALLVAARAVAKRVETIANPVVADFVSGEDGSPRLIELNGFSTSGLYAGADMKAIANCLEGILV